MTNKFAPHYQVYITYEDDQQARDEGLPELTEEITIPAPARTPDGDRAAVVAAVEMANKRNVGAEGRVIFKEFCVYVTFKHAFGESDLLATVVRAYSWDTNADYTFASAHIGRIPYQVIDEICPPAVE